VSRIDDALRNASVRDAAQVAAPAKSAVFVSAWGTTGEPAHVETGTVRTILQDSDPIEARSQPTWSHVLVDSPQATGLMNEQFRRLAGQLHQAQTERQMKLVMVTSAAAGDGKSLTAVNLALALSGSYQRQVLLIDADLRRPSVADIYGLSDRRGLSEALQARTEQKLPVIQLREGLTLLPAGRPDPDPMAGLSSERMQRILRDASERFDWIIVDGPPVGVVADATILAPAMDAVLFVVRAGVTPYRHVERALDAIGKNRIFGVVLNAVDADNFSDYGSYYSDAARRP
jgi:protein-tyrosine kinase